MTQFRSTVAKKSYSFDNLKALLAKASPARSGDALAGIAAADDEERVAAQMALADVPLRQFLDEPIIPYEDDEVTRLIVDSHDRAAFEPVVGPDGRRVSRLAAALRDDKRSAQRAWRPG